MTPTSVDQIRRYGGSTAPSMPWPEEPGDYGSEDKFERLVPRWVFEDDKMI